MNNGMRPSVFHNPDPTYEKTKTNLNQEYKRNLCEVEAFFEEIRRCRKHIDSLNHFRWLCRNDKEACGWRLSIRVARPLLSKRRLQKSEELRDKEAQQMMVTG